MSTPVDDRFWRGYYLERMKTAFKSAWILAALLGAVAAWVFADQASAVIITLAAYPAVCFFAAIHDALSGRKEIIHGLRNDITTLRLEMARDPDKEEMERLEAMQIFKQVYDDLVRLKTDDALRTRVGQELWHWWNKGFTWFLTPVAKKRFDMKVEEYRKENGAEINDELKLRIASMIGAAVPFTSEHLKYEWLNRTDLLLDPKHCPPLLDAIIAKRNHS